MDFDKKQKRIRQNIASFDEKSDRRAKWDEKQNYRKKDRFKNKKSQAPQSFDDKEIDELDN